MASHQPSNGMAATPPHRLKYRASKSGPLLTDVVAKPEEHGWGEKHFVLKEGRISIFPSQEVISHRCSWATYFFLLSLL